MSWRIGYYVVKGGRMHVGPFKTEAEAQDVIDANPGILSGCTIEYFGGAE